MTQICFSKTKMGLLNSPLDSARQFPSMFTVKIVITELHFTRALLNLNKILCQHHSFLSEQEDCLTRTRDKGVFSLFHQLRHLSVDWLLTGCRLNIWEIIKQNLSKSSSGAGRPPVVSEPARSSSTPDLCSSCHPRAELSLAEPSRSFSS